MQVGKMRAKRLLGMVAVALAFSAAPMLADDLPDDGSGGAGCSGIATTVCGTRTNRRCIEEVYLPPFGVVCTSFIEWDSPIYGVRTSNG